MLSHLHVERTQHTHALNALKEVGAAMEWLSDAMYRTRANLALAGRYLVTTDIAVPVALVPVGCTLFQRLEELPRGGGQEGLHVQVLFKTLCELLG